MKLAYVAGPYRSEYGPNGIYENIHKARSVAVHLWHMGFAVICPHTNTAFMDGDMAHSDAAKWLEGDLEILRRCDLVVAMPLWVTSHGAVGEVEEARRLGIPVYYYPGDSGALEKYAKEELL